MLALICASVLTEAESAQLEPFLEPGGIHLVAVSSMHGVISGLSIYFSAANNVPRRNNDDFAAAGAGVAIANLATGILAGHFLRPSPVVAYESALLSWAGFYAGIAAGELYVLSRLPSGFDINLAWPIRFIAAAVAQCIASWVPLFPARRDPPGWHLLVVAAAGAVGVGVGLGISKGGTGLIIAEPAALFAPLALAGTASLLLRVLLPDQPVEVAPAPMNGGVGLVIGVR